MKRVSIIVCVLLTLAATTLAQSDPLQRGRQAMGDREYAAAVKQFDAVLADGQAKSRDEAAYLKARALHDDKQYDQSIAAAESMLTQFPQSPWAGKAIFLKAQNLLQLRRFPEAEKIYEQQTHRLLDPKRKAQIAQVLIDFAEQLCVEPDPAKPDMPKPEYEKSYQLLGKVLEMEIGTDLRDDVMFRRAQISTQAKNFGRAVNDFSQYLNQFDPTFGRAPDQKSDIETHDPVGKHINDARLGLAIARINNGQHDAARRGLEDLLALLDKASPLLPQVRWQIVRSYRLPGPPPHQLQLAVKAARDFLTAFPADPRSVIASWHIAVTLQNAGKADDAIAAYEDFIAGRNYQLPQGEALTAKITDFDASPQKLHDDLVMRASYNIGAIRFNQKQYDQAVAAWTSYTKHFPNGPQWSAAQNSIINAEFQQGIEQVAAGQYEQARKLLDQFTAAHPLDARCRRIQFLYGQMSVEQANTLKKAKAPEDQITAAYHQAIDTWQKLAEKYPGSPEASLALFRIGELYETQLHQLDKAIETYRRVNFGQWAGAANQHIAAMIQKHLALSTPRAYLTTEQPQVSLDIRNIEKVTVRQYRLDLEAYFRKTHQTGGVDQLDISLIQPDKTWDVTIADYAKYKPIHQMIDVPFDGKAPGVYLVNVASDDWEATTLVIRSDIDLIVQSTGKQVLTFVQDMRTGKPAVGADVLVCRGDKVVATGKTGSDGVCVLDAPQSDDAAPANNNSDSNNVQVFAALDGSVASFGVDVSGIAAAAGLQPRGYLYTDRPAYLPGQPVYFRGILRQVADGQYQPPVDQAFTFDVLDPAGRVIWSQTLTANRFGSIHSQFTLDDAAPLGNYSLRVQRKDQPNSPVFTGSFSVQKFTLPKVRLTITTPEDVYFRGQIVEWNLDAGYTFGAPLADRVIRYQLPDGRTLTGRTDDKGKLTVKFDTTAMVPGRMLTLNASIDGENVNTSQSVLLAELGFNITLETARDVALAGEPVDLTITTNTPDGKPTAQELTLEISRIDIKHADPVLAAVPWIGSQDASEPVRVTTQKVKTGADGKVIVPVKLDSGGRYVLRVSGTDRFGQPVAGDTALMISDDKDATRLRLFADTTTVQVGSSPVVRVHNRLGKALALVTLSGDRILEHRVMPINEGYNDLSLKIDHAQYPNFRLTVNVLHPETSSEPNATGRGQPHQADLTFDVQRQLNVTVKPVADVYQPGAKGKVELTVTDQLGKPVEAELSLALVDESLYALYDENVADILDFFQQDAHRDDALRIGSTIGFSYQSQTCAVNTLIAGETERMVRMAEEANQLRPLRTPMGRDSNVILDSVTEGRIARGYPGNANANAPEATVSQSTSDFASDRTALVQSAGTSSKLVARNGSLYAFGMEHGGLGSGTDQQQQPRRELPAAGVWLPDIVTDAAGKATVEITLPEKTTEWRITSRGITPRTLAGQATAQVITRKDFIVDLKLPATLMQGDRLSPIARLHNLTADAGEATVSLIVKSTDGAKKLAEQNRTVKLDKNGNAELTFDPVEITTPGGARIELNATFGKLADGLVRDMTVQPWGIAYAAHHGGVSETDVTTLLAVSGKGEQGMTIDVGPGVEQSVIDWALRQYPMPVFESRAIMPPPQWGGTPGGELLAVASALDYARSVQAPVADIDQLTRRAMQLVQTLTVTQNGSGFWQGIDAGDPWYTSSISFWALARAKSLGITVENTTMEKAQQYLQGAFRKVDANDNDAKAAILHALSLVDQADFANINRLHRERNTLSNPALAFTALALANQKRPDIAGELLDVLAQRVKQAGEDHKQVYWTGSDKQPIMAGDVDATALAALAMAKVRPDSPLLAPAVNWLIDQRGCFDWVPASSRGPAIAAAAEFYHTAKPIASNYKLDVLVNGKSVATLNVTGDTRPQRVVVPADAINEDKNIVELRKNGQGRFTWAASLQRFRSELTDPESFPFHLASRTYRHDQLTYNGRDIGATSTSPVKHIEVGQHVGVYLNFDNRSSHDGYLMITEPIPAGMTLVHDSIVSNAVRVDVAGDHFTLFYMPRTYIRDVQYELVGYTTGDYRVLPTVIRDANRPDRMRVAAPADLAVLKPGEKSDDPYQMNHGERFALGQLNFGDGHYAEAMKYLGELFKSAPQYNERDLARMLLWIATSEGFYDAQRIVQTFEILRERYPELEIPFDRILVVGRAYRDLGEMERAAAAFRATLDVSFANDVSISAVLEDEGQFLASIDYCEDLWRQYPDTGVTSSAYFALSQSLYRMAPRAEELAKQATRIVHLPGHSDAVTHDKPTRIDLLKRTAELLESFLTLYSQNPLADDAAFSLDNAYLDMKLYQRVVLASQRFEKLYPDSDFNSGFQYMAALGYFWQRDYAPALKAAMQVADGQSKDKNLATYIVGQVYHAQDEPGKAIDWYQKVADQYTDAKESIDYFKHQSVSMEEVNVFRPGEAVKLTLKYRNIKQAAIQVYRVDLMKLYLREKNLTNVTQVNLAGISPLAGESLTLGDGKDYIDKQKAFDLSLKDEGAYLLIVRGDDLFTSALVLVTPLELKIQEEPAGGRVRVNVIDEVKHQYVANVHVKAIGSANDDFVSGETDLRGIHIADGINGKATVIARGGKDNAQYAFYRGEQWVGQPPNDPNSQPMPRTEQAGEQLDYQQNLKSSNNEIQFDNTQQFEQLRRNSQKGVQVKQAY